MEFIPTILFISWGLVVLPKHPKLVPCIGRTDRYQMFQACVAPPARANNTTNIVYVRATTQMVAASFSMIGMLNPPRHINL